MKKFMKENYLNSNIKLNRFNGFLSVQENTYDSHLNLLASLLLLSSLHNRDFSLE